MTKKIRQQIISRAIIASPIIAGLTATPFYIIYDLKFQLFLLLSLLLTFGTLFWWGIQTVVFSYFQKKNYAHWQYGITLIMSIVLFVYVTTSPVATIAASLSTYAPVMAFLLRFLVAAGINLIIYLLLDLIFTREKSIQLVKKNAALQYHNLETEYKLLKAQINPHFLFNALNISKSLIKTQPKKAEKYLLQLSDFLRKSLNNQSKSIDLQEELKHCEQFVALQKVRFEKAFHFNVQIEALHFSKKLPFFALVTLVENALKHNSFSKKHL